MSDVFENKGAMAATIVVAASDSLNKGAANYVCDGTADNVQIQAAVDALRKTIIDEAFTIGPFSVWDTMDDPVVGGWAALQGDETLTRDAGVKFEGAASLKILGGPTDDPGAKMLGLASLDWSGYDTLTMAIKAAAPAYGTLNIRLYIYDSGGTWEYFESRAVCNDGWNDIDFDFNSPRANSGAALDWTDVVSVDFRAVVNDNAYTFYVDYLRLNKWDELDNNFIHPASETITDNGTTYIKDTDYEMDYKRGKIRGIHAGGMVSGNTYYADYTYGKGHVKLLEGTYNIEATISLYSNISFIGCGFGSLLKLADAVNANVLVVTAGSQNVLISDLQIDGNRENQEYDPAGNETNGIRTIETSYSTIQNCWVHHCILAGIVPDARVVGGPTYYPSHDISIAHCVISYCGTHGVVLRWDSHKCSVANCHVFKCGDVSGFGIQTYVGSKNNTIIGNICHDNFQQGIDIRASLNCTVANNNCYANLLAGIQIHDGSSGITVVGNQCNLNGIDGILLNNEVSHCLIASNILSANSQMKDATWDNIRISNNCDYNLVCNNVSRRGTEPNKPRYGINISDDTCDRNCVIGNDLYDSGSTGDLNDAPATNPTLKHDNRNNAGTGWLAEV